MSAATTTPLKKAITNPIGFSITGRIKIPPCGALDAHPKNIASPPATAEPTVTEGNTRNGSAAAKEIAPYVINERPNI